MMTNREYLLLNFWTAFKNYMSENSFIRCRKPTSRHYTNHKIGKSGFQLGSTALTSKSEIGVGFVIKNSKKTFKLLEEQRGDIETEMGQALIWHNPEGKKRCRIYLRKSYDFTNNKSWPEAHVWLQKNLEKFHKIFGSRIK